MKMYKLMHSACRTVCASVRPTDPSNGLPDGELNFHDIFRLLRLFCVNSYPCRAAGSTSGLLKWGTMINHSCRANVTFQSVSVGGDFEGRYRAVRPIRKGDVLGSSYMKPAMALASLVHRRRR